MLLVKLIAMGKDNAPFNSGAFEKACSKLNVILIDENLCSNAFKEASQIIDKSALDKEKRQYKSESETLLVTKAFEEHIQNKGQQTP
jgi:hypothetical protein